MTLDEPFAVDPDQLRAFADGAHKWAAGLGAGAACRVLDLPFPGAMVSEAAASVNWAVTQLLGAIAMESEVVSRALDAVVREVRVADGWTMP
ncbi:MAG: hypothetical protein ACT4OX_11500 [Actinomycetota bacterium]